jgi:hypothetical protein
MPMLPSSSGVVSGEGMSDMCILIAFMLVQLGSG